MRDNTDDIQLKGIAIIGIACNFPGANNKDKFWKNLCNGIVSKETFSKQDMIKSGISEDLVNNPAYMPYGYVINDIDSFDAAFFEYPPDEAKLIDPQQRLFLQCCWNAFEDAGYIPDNIKESVGVFASSKMSSYMFGIHERLKTPGTHNHMQTLMGNDKDYISSRVSYKFNLKGPSVTVQTACSSSLVAVHMACESLLHYECDMAIAGGVAVSVPDHMGYLYQEGMIYSPDGLCRTFDENANGTVFGNGLGVVILKRTNDAFEDKDQIYAIIRGSAVNNDGSLKAGYTAPGIQGQIKVIQEAQLVSSINPATIGYAEAHGTGTPIGDPIEIEALSKTFNKHCKEKQFCAIGSVKSNIGHLEAAAGIASLIKTALCLKHKTIVPSMNFNQPNSRIDFENSPFFVNTILKKWDSNGFARRACVSSFGIGGTNAHAILEQGPKAKIETKIETKTEPEIKFVHNEKIERTHYLFTLSAKTKTSLKNIAQKYVKMLSKINDSQLGNLCYSVGTGRKNFNCRIAINAESVEQLQSELIAFCQDSETKNLVSSITAQDRELDIAFMFTGQGAQYHDMGRLLYETQPIFKKELEKCADILRSYMEQPLLSLMFGNNTQLIHNTRYAQPATFALEYALSKMFINWGIKPSILMGHSVGEYVAACIAEVFSLEHGLKLIVERGRLMDELCSKGSMYSVFANQNKIEQILQKDSDKISMVAFNGPEHTVISGEDLAVENFIKQLEKSGIGSIKLNVSGAFHSHLMAPMLKEFKKIAESVEYFSPKIRVVSNVSGKPQKNFTPEYWVNHVMQPVDFQSSIKFLEKEKINLFYEIGPNPVLCKMGQKCITEKEKYFAYGLKKNENNWHSIIENLKHLYVNGGTIDWHEFDHGNNRKKITLPTYCFDKKRLWIQDNGLQDHELQDNGLQEHHHNKDTNHLSSYLNSLAGVCLNLPTQEIVYEFIFNNSFIHCDKIHDTTVVSETTFLEMLINSATDIWKNHSIEIENFCIEERLILDDNITKLHMVLCPGHDDEYEIKIFSNKKDSIKISHTFDDFNLHASGKLQHKPIIKGKRVSLEALKQACAHSFSMYDKNDDKNDDKNKELHKDLWARVQDKQIEAIWTGEKQVLAQIGLWNNNKSAEYYAKQPGLIKACTQLIQACMPVEKEHIYVISGYDRFKLYRSFANALWCHFFIKDNESDKENFSASFKLFNEIGEVIAQAWDVRFKKVPLNSFHITNKDKEKLIYEIKWLKQHETIKESTTQFISIKHDYWIIFSNNKNHIGNELAELFKTHQAICLIVYPGESYKKIDLYQYEINPFLKDDYQRLFQENKEIDLNRLKGIIQLWSIEDSFLDSKDNILEYLHHTCESTLLLFQTITSLQKINAGLWIITRGAHTISNEDSRSNPLQRSLWGLGNVILQEYPETFRSMIDLDLKSESKIEAKTIFQEILSPSNETHLALRQKTIYVPRLVSSDLPPSFTEATPIEFTGTHVITGGFGGLGIETAKWLALHGAKNIVLIGRNKAKDKARKAIDSLKLKGVSILEAHGDVSDIDQIDSIFKQIQSSMPPIKGIFHLPGILDDGLIAAQNWKRFKGVIMPKALGAWNLHSLTLKMDLDYFVMFSSLVSLIGNQGQGSYATANAFLDGLANYRKTMGLPALTINWGPWGEVGMAADIKNLQNAGMKPLSTSQGFEMLYRLLQNDFNQAGIMSIKWNRFVDNMFGTNKVSLFDKLVSLNQTEQKQDEDTSLSQKLIQSSDDQRTSIITKEIQNHISKVLWLDDSQTLNMQKSLTELGFDSMMIVEFREFIRAKLGVDIPLREFIKNSDVDSLIETVMSRFQEKPHESDGKEPKFSLPKIEPDLENRFNPFPLTDVQHAYWMGGRSGFFELSHIACHLFLEVDIIDLDLKKLENAFNLLVKRHDMLRAVILSNGMQQIMQDVPLYKIDIYDLKSKDKESQKSHFESIYEKMSHQLLPVDSPPMIDLKASLIDQRRTRLHMSFDLLIGDGFSFGILIKDLYHFYTNPHIPLPEFKLSFRDYVIAQENLKNSDLYKESLQYWNNKIETIPPRPDLPLAKLPFEIRVPAFIRYRKVVESDIWNLLKQKASLSGLTSSGVLLAAFAEILQLWNKNSAFTINLTLFNRLPLHEEVNEIVGDFTTLTMLSIDTSSGVNFKSRARIIQEQLWNDLEHRYVSGIEIMREIFKKNEENTVPIVFTSALPYTSSESETSMLGGLPKDIEIEFVNSISQTPQVWLDHQVSEIKGQLIINWDVVKGLFPNGLMEEMFNSYIDLVYKLANNNMIWEESHLKLLPENQLIKREKINNTHCETSNKTLHALFEDQVNLNPDHTALIYKDLDLSYKKISKLSDQVAHLLQQKESISNSVVAVIMEKGWEQVVALLGILKAGAAYLPIDPNNPIKRIIYILNDCNVKIVLTQSHLKAKFNTIHDMEFISVDKYESQNQQSIQLESHENSDDLAYVIYTSGSTGRPKGVMTTHKGAVNTIIDMNKRFNVGVGDKVMALSGLHFDLSVYDIFGTLAAGATIVMPESLASKDPWHWSMLVDKHHITIWNSVPMLMKMFVEHLLFDQSKILKTLRLILLSGDWIPLDLPDKINSLTNENCQIISLGGATEASIWSVIYPITNIKSEWKSIPYGFPMANQQLYVLNKNMHECPDLVTGDIYIGGIGLAKGYWKDNEKTKHSFLVHPQWGVRLGCRI